MSKLISWNIAGRIKARSAQLDWIEQEEADVLALQEVIGACDLRERLLKLGFKFFHPAKPAEGRSKLVAVASRQPFAVISAFTVTHPERAISCRISLSNKKVELHCVHVPDGSNYGGPIKVEFLEAVTSGLSTRKLPQLLVGDFNCPRFVEPVVVTWAQKRKDGGWQLNGTRDGIARTRWDAAERSILCPRVDMSVARFCNGSAIVTYPKKVGLKGGGNCFDHVIASKTIMPRRIESVLNTKLSDHAALVAEW